MSKAGTQFIAISFLCGLLAGCSYLPDMPSSVFGDDSDAPFAGDVQPIMAKPAMTGDSYPNLASVKDAPVPVTENVPAERAALLAEQKETAVLAAAQRSGESVIVDPPVAAPVTAPMVATETETVQMMAGTAITPPPAPVAASAAQDEIKVPSPLITPETTKPGEVIAAIDAPVMPSVPLSSVTPVMGKVFLLNKAGSGRYELMAPQAMLENAYSAAPAASLFFLDGENQLSMVQYNSLKRLVATQKQTKSILRVVGYSNTGAAESVDAAAAERTLLIASYLIDLGAAPESLRVQFAPLSGAPNATSVVSDRMAPYRVDVRLDSVSGRRR